MLPTFFGVSLLDGRPKLARWHKFFMHESKAAEQSYADVWAGLEAWWDRGRWEKLGMVPVLAGKPTSPLLADTVSP